MSFWRRLWGSPDIIKEGVSMIRDAGDALVYTDEEKAQDRAKSVSESRRMIVEWMQATAGQNLARRLLAVSITFVWLAMYISQMALNIISSWVQVSTAAKLAENAVTIGQFAESMNGAVMLILSFYFAAPHMDKIVVEAMKKFSSNKENKTGAN